MSRYLPLLSCGVLLALIASGVAHASGQVTVYRCEASNGKVTLGDAPCPAGQRQETREMIRPQDPPPAPAPVAAPTPPPTAPIVRDVVVYRTPPRPMYECTNVDDSKTYTSDNGDGNPRLVPIWSLGYRGRGSVVVGNTWVRDTCHQLPQAEVCDRLRDRRYEILRQYHSALQSERQALDREQRGVDARLGNDCGAG
ncbi:protein of unknown function [Pseudoxanthomonas sp. GM95]|uniref:DUF4124 domain-containing protein n=1 Tax=Pseudoxanthomonas sp. GM95 TaxID=1881043 RepID=UPI0008D330E6|nr:DUF4124 domain-containing protein [Pseudoxanthomonas sp. GM95]SEL55490.1 protein of unknown function [Pseudoxanthomonas sp. GM95]